MFISKLMKYLAVIFILFLSLFLRLKNNSLVPLPGESIDEYSNTWVGLSLLSFGVPVGISSDVGGYSSSIKAYVNVDEIYQSRGGDSLTLRTNWFDHPPLAGLVSAVYTKMRGGSVFEDATSRNVRKPVIVAGVLTTLILFLIGMEIYGFKAGIIGSLLYTISPTVLFGSRPVQAENYYIPIILISFYLLLKYFKNNRIIFLIISGILFGVATLFKISSVFLLPVVIILILNNQGKNKLVDIGYFLVTFVPISLLFFTYGMAINLSDFMQVFLGNTQRGFAIGPDLFDSLLRLTKIGFRAIPDLWVLLSWMAALILIPKINSKSKDYPLFVFFICYLFFFVLTGGNGYSWYYLPFFPITFLFLGNLVVKLLSESKYYLVIYFMGMAIAGVYFRRLMGQPSPLYINTIWRYLSLSTLVFYVANYFVDNKYLHKIVTVITYGVFVGAMVMTFLYGYNMSPASWFQAY